MAPVPFTSDQWSYLKPEDTPPIVTADTLLLPSAPRTDWWHVPGVDSKSGRAYGFWTDPSPGFTAAVDIDVSYKVQATIFLYAGESHWIKIGLEYDMDELWSSVVVTNPYSDWSIYARPPGTSKRFTIQVSAKSERVRISLGGKPIRDIHGFTLPDKVFLGLMSCSPLGDSVDATYQKFDFTLGDAL